jgi:hypothetical protein
MRKPIAFISFIMVLFFFFIPSLSYPLSLTLNNTSTPVVNCPRGGCNKAIIREFNQAMTEVLIQTFSLTIPQSILCPIQPVIRY